MRSLPKRKFEAAQKLLIYCKTIIEKQKRQVATMLHVMPLFFNRFNQILNSILCKSQIILLI